MASVTQTIGPPPLEGQLRLTPPPGGAGWMFEIDLNGDGSPDHAGSSHWTTASRTPPKGFSLVTLLNVYTAEHRSQLPWSRPYHHFDVSPRGDLFAAASWGEKPPVIVVADQQTLTPRHNIVVPKFVHTLAFDPAGERLFASAYREHEDGGFSYRLVMIDPYSGTILRDMWGATGMGLSFCEGNPAARSANGRWIVFACYGATVLDATTGFPVAILEGTVYAVAAGIEDDVFYIAHSDGTVEKIEIVE